MEDRSELFNQLKNFSQRKLKKVETKVVTASGEQLVEKRGAKGLQVLSGDKAGSGQDVAEPPKKLDLQVGLVLPGFLLGSQDVAHDKSSLDSYGITHILNLDSDIENKFEDDYNYKNINIHDRSDFDLDKVYEDCFDFIDDGRHYGNVLIHCSGTIGLSRSTSICIAYLMNKEKQKFNEAFNNVKEARSFVKPNEGFIKQLKDYEVKLRGAQEIKESGIDDPFALRKKQEIEQEKAMVAGAASVKNRMKMFGATLDTNNAGARSKSVSPSPIKTPQSPSVSKWSTSGKDTEQNNNKLSSASKSMTPEPRKSNWSSKKDEPTSGSSWRQTATSGPPPPPPPMPTTALNDDKSIKPLSSSRSPLPPPPPPPQPPAGDLLKDSSNTKSTSSSRGSSRAHDNNDYKERRNSNTSDKQRTVFGRVPPPPMKLVGGSSIEKHDPVSDKNMGFNKSTKSSLQLPLKRQATNDSGADHETAPSENPRAPSPSAALRAAKQQASAKQSGADRGNRSPTSDQHRPSVCGQLNRSSTKKLLNLIKTKTKSDLTLPDGDENDEIEALLGALENESIENIDWDELGLDEDEVKEIIEKGAAGLSSSSSSSSSSSDEETEEEEEEVETTTQHFIIRTK